LLGITNHSPVIDNLITGTVIDYRKAKIRANFILGLNGTERLLRIRCVGSGAL